MATWHSLGVTSGLTAIAVKTSAYTAASGEFVPVDITNSSFTVLLPTAPADKSQVAIKVVGISGTNTVTIARGGTDVFNKTGGSTSLSLSLLNQSLVMQYTVASGIWYVVSTDVPLVALDSRYATNAGSAPVTVTRDASGNISSYSAPGEVISSIVRSSSGIISWTENGVARTIQRDSSGRITGVV